MSEWSATAVGWPAEVTLLLDVQPATWRFFVGCPAIASLMLDVCDCDRAGAVQLHMEVVPVGLAAA